MPDPLLDGWYADHSPGVGKQIVVSAVTLNAGGLTGIGSDPVALSDTSITFYGLAHLAGKTVQACIGGLDCGDYVVANDGSIQVLIGAADGLLTIAYLVSIDGFVGEQAVAISLVIESTPTVLTVPVVIGQGYTTRGQLLRPATAEDIHSDKGSALGEIRRAHEYSVLFSNTGHPVSFGTDFSNLVAVDFRDAGDTPITGDQLFSGPYWEALDDTYSFNGQLCWEVTRPVPLTIVACSIFLASEN